MYISWPDSWNSKCVHTPTKIHTNKITLHGVQRTGKYNTHEQQQHHQQTLIPTGHWCGSRSVARVRQRRRQIKNRYLDQPKISFDICRHEPHLSNKVKVKLPPDRPHHTPNTHTKRKCAQKLKQSEWQTNGESNKRNGTDLSGWGKMARSPFAKCTMNVISSTNEQMKKCAVSSSSRSNEKTHKLLRLRFNYLMDGRRKWKKDREEYSLLLLSFRMLIRSLPERSCAANPFNLVTILIGFKMCQKSRRSLCYERVCIYPYLDSYRTDTHTRALTRKPPQKEK